MFPFIMYPQSERRSPLEDEYMKLMKKMLKKQLGDDEKKKEEEKKKGSSWDKVTKLEVAFLLLAFTPLWLPLYIAGIRMSILITRQLLQGI